MKNNASKLVSIAAVCSAAFLANAVSAAVIDFEDIDTSSWGGEKRTPTPLANGTYDWYAGNNMGIFSYDVVYDGKGWNGFKASQATDTSDKTYNNDCASNAGGGAGGSLSYGILYGNVNASHGTDGALVTFSDALTLDSIDLCNTAYMQNSVVNGDDFTDSFADIDGEIYFNLRLRGMDINGNYSDYLDISLAAKDSLGNITTLADGNWTTIVLDKLNLEGGLYGLEFSFEGSENLCNKYGYLNTPAYIAFDNINYSMAVPEPAEWAAVFGAIALVIAAYRRRK